MNLDAVMQQIADQIDTIADLRVHAHPAGTIAPPAAVVSYPEITFDETYGRGMDRYELPVVVLVGKVSDRAARDRLAAYVNGSGATSIKQVVEAGTYTAFDTVRVARVDFDVIAFGAVEHLAATFTLDIAGQGAP